MARKTASESILREKTVSKSKVKVASDSRFRSLKNISIISTILVIAICIVLNLILDFTLDQKLTFDSTSVKTNSISRYSENYLDTIEKKVEIIGLFDRNDTSIELLDYFLPIMDDYEAKSNGKIEVKYIDPDVDPFILTELDEDGLYGLRSGMYVVRSEDRMLPLYLEQCFEFDSQIYSAYGVYLPVTNLIEVNVTGSISYVTSSRPRVAYILTDHGNTSGYTLAKILKTFGFVTSELSLNSDAASVPDDCEILMILEPSSDLSASEKNAIMTYLDNHGKILVVNDFEDNQNVDYTNLNEITKRMGVSLENGVLHENSLSALKNVDDPYHSIGFATEYCLQSLLVSSYFDVQNCRYLKIVQDSASTVQVAPLVVTSDEASVDFMNTQIDASVSSGTYPVVLVSCDTAVTNEPPYMIMIGTDAFTSDANFTTLNDDGNVMFMRALLNDVLQIEWYTGEEATLVPEKTLPSYILTQPLSSSAATWWSLCIMTIIPVGSLICGIYIYHKRRHL